MGNVFLQEAYYWGQFYVTIWVGLDNKNSITGTKVTTKSSLKQLPLTVHWLTLDRAYYWEDSCLFGWNFFFWGGGGGGGP